jgi:Carboxypeptidase regulatory-like domain/TonB-dependent Receptor Plug Domain
LLASCSLALVVVLFCDIREVNAQSPVYTVGGIVTDRSSIPIASALLTLKCTGQHPRNAYTNKDGRFFFPDVAEGAASLTARSLGFQAMTVKLDISAATAATPVGLALEAVPAQLDTVTVSMASNRIQEFNVHKANPSFGRFFEQAEIEKRRPAHVSDLFRTVPGVSMTAASIGNNVKLRGCKPTVWMDGIRVPGAEVDEVANAPDVAGIELYTSWAGLPAEYKDQDTQACGVIVVWSKSR